GPYRRPAGCGGPGCRVLRPESFHPVIPTAVRRHTGRLPAIGAWITQGDDGDFVAIEPQNEIITCQPSARPAASAAQGFVFEVKLPCQPPTSRLADLGASVRIAQIQPAVGQDLAVYPMSHRTL